MKKTREERWWREMKCKRRISRREGREWKRKRRREMEQRVGRNVSGEGKAHHLHQDIEMPERKGRTRRRRWRRGEKKGGEGVRRREEDGGEKKVGRRG